MGTLAITAMRNTRRRGGGLLEQVQDASRHLHEHFPSEGFVTASTLQIDLATGRGMAVNAGHQLRSCYATGPVHDLRLEANLPLGLFDDTQYHIQQLELQAPRPTPALQRWCQRGTARRRGMFGEERVRPSGTAPT